MQQKQTVLAVTYPSMSGIIKRYADTFPEDQASRWLLRLLSDRVDAFEYEVANTVKNPWFLLSATLSAGAALYLIKKKAHRNAPCSSQEA